MAILPEPYSAACWPASICLRVYDTVTATYVAVALNVTVAVIALVLAAAAARYEVPACPATTGHAGRVAGALGRASGDRPLGDVGAGCRGGLDPLAISDAWRDRVYVFLDPGRVPDRPWHWQQLRRIPGAADYFGAGALGACQWLLTAAIAWTAVMISESLPYWPIAPDLSSSPWYTFQLDLVRCLWAILPPASLWGASFPLALAAVASRGQDPGRLVGGVYAANTIGGIAGALAFSLWLVPAIGTAHAEQVLIGLAAAASLVALWPLVRRGSAYGAPGSRGRARGCDRRGRRPRMERRAGAVGARGLRP